MHIHSSQDPKKNDMELISLQFTGTNSNTDSALSVCTKESSSRHPHENYLFDLEKAKEIENIQISSAEVIYFIIERLSLIGAPVALMYGTLLHEFRNGTGSCVIPRADDKDFDMAVFEEHFHLIKDMRKEIESMFGFTVGSYTKRRLFMILYPPGTKSFQIDIYGFRCDNTNKLIYFPWDAVAVQMKHFLPLVKHKTLPVDTNSTSVSEHLYHRVPFNPRCLLESLYGKDFMTPKSGHFLLHSAFTHPEYAICEKEMNVFEKEEFIRQQSFCQSNNFNVLTNKIWRKWMLEEEEKSMRDQGNKINRHDETSFSMNDKSLFLHNSDLRSGIITCIE